MEAHMYGKFFIAGPGAEEAAAGLALLLETEFGCKPIRFSRERHCQDESQDESQAEGQAEGQSWIEDRYWAEGQSRKLDVAAAAAIAGVILALPSAILAAVDLVQRIRNKKKVDEFNNRLQPHLEKYPHVTINFITCNGQVINLRTTTSTELLDAFSGPPEENAGKP